MNTSFSPVDIIIYHLSSLAILSSFDASSVAGMATYSRIISNSSIVRSRGVLRYLTLAKFM